MASSALIAQGIDRRRALVRFLKAYLKKNGYSPSIEEITVGIGLTSKTATRHHLDVLRDEGTVTWTEGRYRSLRLVEKSEKA